MLKIKLARHTGFCSGVRRAINIVEKTLKAHKGKVYSYGSIIHNPLVIRSLEKKNLIKVSALNDVQDSSVVILPSHGSPRAVLNAARKKKLKLVNVICPYVSFVHRICQRLYKNKFKVVIVGDKAHPEVKALIDLAPDARIIENSGDIKENEFSQKKIGIISQTTQAKDKFFRIVGEILRKNHHVLEVHIFNTICLDTSKRQEEVKSIAGAVDVLLVIGSQTSANTKRLLQLGRRVNKKTFLVEDDKTRLESITKKAKSIGIISGASAPQWLVKAIVKKIRQFKSV